MRIEPLPPLQNLIAFEATVRHGSFTRAAAELHLTQSAISRQVAQLEEFLGRALFRREHKRIHLTVAGQIYAEEVLRVLTHCAEATAQVITHTGEQELTLASSSGVAALWLGPLLGRYSDEFPSVEIRLRVVDSLESLVRAEFDLALYFLRKPSPPGFDSRLLFVESVGAYCSPDFLKGEVLEPEQLTEHRLLMLEDGQRKWLSWVDWFSYYGVDASLIRQRMSVNHYPVLVDLAIAGHGIVLGWRPMIDRHLRSGALVPACNVHAGAAGGGYYLLNPQGQVPSRAARAFEKWMMSTIAI
ncbi:MULTISPECIES: LysR substrate-binding domain-containing protein [Pseudomonas]|uniref:LysR substrate-binding domain-containing protein n=1 Tax=Pseudomonas TaxID=286 RepID=UPI000BA218AF|nr:MULTISPECIES: LysR substrate-binding domain-containing protein [Pseudomonas]MDY7568952.1 LysR substrate-binding domain-containing protein [Pseudomonas sp. CCC4.1]MEB0144306.1 LysR substrate-binding domain-containing protein [Pseudomonas sp. CCC4.1]PAA37340.1 LysR family transcriptional regulator [Pseudomonas fragi]PAA37563.1 LysR family transcriptional regulator [Pseudomonas fragi]HBP48810.1 LysR family transcriptional regulator [Pseudomonas sp.]